MGVPYTSYQRSIGMDEASARAIAARTSLFGYKPDCIPIRGLWHLSICSDADAETVKRVYAEMKAQAA